MDKNFCTRIVNVFWKRVGGLLRINVETIQNIARKLQTHTRIGLKYAHITLNQKEKLDGRMIRTTVVWRTVREILIGIDKTDGSHVQRAHIANFICSYRASCACEPSVLSIPNGISSTLRYTPVVRILRPSNFSFWFLVGRASARPIRVCFSRFRAIFWIVSTSFHNNPSTFFQNTYTRLVRKFIFIFFSHSSKDNW